MTIPSFPDVGAVVAGKLRVIRALGVGGMGAVYEVEHTITKHRRALKLLHRELAASPSVVQRFLREASAAGRIGNAHVVETFDAGTLDTGEPYIVMELLEGRTLADEIAERGALPVTEACEILLQACDGVRAAHAAGIVHRDLKPENVFLVSGDKPFVKILDFGISKFDPELTGAHGLTQEGSALGTPYYMPPEQVRGDKTVSAQADVYALGVMLYECLTGGKPYSAETLPHLVVLIHEGRYAPPSMRRPELPPECDAVVATAMAADRQKRYATVDEFMQALVGLGGSGARLGDARTLLVTPGVASPNTAELGTPAAVRARIDSAPSPATAASPVAPGALSVAPESQAPASSRTEGAFGNTRAASESSSKVALWVALGVGAVLAGGGAWWLSGRGTAPVESEPASAVSEEAPAPSVVAPSTPRAEVVVVPPELAPAPSAGASASSARSEASARPPAAVVAPKASSRARELGLSEENPFR